MGNLTSEMMIDPMSEDLTSPQITNPGGVIETPHEVVEVLPPSSPELERSVTRIYEKYQDAFEEMKRRGD